MHRFFPIGMIALLFCCSLLVAQSSEKNQSERLSTSSQSHQADYRSEIIQSNPEPAENSSQEFYTYKPQDYWNKTELKRRESKLYLSLSLDRWSEQVIGVRVGNNPEFYEEGPLSRTPGSYIAIGRSIGKNMALEFSLVSSSTVKATGYYGEYVYEWGRRGIGLRYLYKFPINETKASPYASYGFHYLQTQGHPSSGNEDDFKPADQKYSGFKFEQVFGLGVEYNYSISNSFLTTELNLYRSSNTNEIQNIFRFGYIKRY